MVDVGGTYEPVAGLTGLTFHCIFFLSSWIPKVCKIMPFSGLLLEAYGRDVTYFGVQVVQLENFKLSWLPHLAPLRNRRTCFLGGWSTEFLVLCRSPGNR